MIQEGRGKKIIKKKKKEREREERERETKFCLFKYSPLDNKKKIITIKEKK